MTYMCGRCGKRKANYEKIIAHHNDTHSNTMPCIYVQTLLDINNNASPLTKSPPLFVMYWSGGNGAKWRIALRSVQTGPLYDAEQRWMIP